MAHGERLAERNGEVGHVEVAYSCLVVVPVDRVVGRQSLVGHPDAVADRLLVDY